MEDNEISLHQVKVYLALKTAEKKWLTVLDVAKLAGIARRTAARHVLKLMEHGLLDQAEVFPGHRYRIADKAAKRNIAYVGRLEKAREVFGL